MSRMKNFGWVAFLVLGAAGSGRPPPAPETDDGVDVTEGNEGEDPGAAAAFEGPEVVRPASGLPAEAQRILAAARETTYSHKTSIDEDEGRFDVDCSGFLGYLLRRVAPGARKELVAATVKRPLAKHFVGFIEGLPDGGTGHWRRVGRALDLRPGDVVAWLRAPDSRSKDTGHVMLVAGTPVGHGARVEIPIFDSTALKHGRGDRRAAGSRTGVGEGTIVLHVDGSGRPVAFRWSPTGKYREHATEIVLARVTR